jgi:hypothetical protein
MRLPILERFRLPYPAWINYPLTHASLPTYILRLWAFLE